MLMTMLLCAKILLQMMNIQSARKEPIDANVTLRVVQLSLDHVQEEPSFKALFIIADTSDLIRVTSYNMSHKATLENALPQGLILVNALFKGSYLLLTSRSGISVCNAFEIPRPIMVRTGTIVQDLETARGLAVSSLTAIQGRVTKVNHNLTTFISNC